MKQTRVLLAGILFLSLSLISCAPSSAAGGWAGIAVEGDLLYTGSLDGKIVCINATDGQLRWLYQIVMASGTASCGETLVPSAIYGTPLVERGMVYVGTYDGKVLALNMVARQEGLTFPQKRYGEWEWSCPTANRGGNAIVTDLVTSGSAIYVSCSNGKVYSLDKEFGDLNWESDALSERLWTSPALHDDIVILSTFEGRLLTVSAESGEVLPWSFESASGFVSRPVIYDHTIYIGSFDNKLYAIEIGASEPLWSFAGRKWFWAAPLVVGGRVYAGCLDGNVYAIESRTGKQLWRFNCKSPIVSSPVVAGDVLVVATESGNVYLIDVETGKGERVKNPSVDSRPTVDARVRASLLVKENKVYIHAQDDCVYRLGVQDMKVEKLFCVRDVKMH